MRRILALLGFLAVLLLALTLLYRVYLHHTSAGPYEDEDSISVRWHVKNTQAAS